MAMKKCPRCDRLFEKRRFPVCVPCQDEEEKDYDKIRDVLERQPDLNAEQVAGEAGVSVSCVTRMVKEGLLSNASVVGDSVKCGMCGAPAISASKKLCQACLEKLNVKVTKAQAGIKLSDKKDAQVNSYLGGARSSFEDKRR